LKKENEAKKEGKRLSYKELMKHAGQVYKKLSDEEKEPYKKKQEEDQVRYKKEMDAYKEKKAMDEKN